MYIHLPFCAKCNSHNIQVSSKTAPDAQLCAEYWSPFSMWSQYTSRPAPKITTAGILGCDTSNAIFFDVQAHQSRKDIAADVSQLLRMMFGKYKDIVKYERFRHSMCIKALW